MSTHLRRRHMPAPATQASRNKFYGQLARNARDSTTFSTIVTLLPDSQDRSSLGRGDESATSMVGKGHPLEQGWRQKMGPQTSVDRASMSRHPRPHLSDANNQQARASSQSERTRPVRSKRETDDNHPTPTSTVRNFLSTHDLNLEATRAPPSYLVGTRSSTAQPRCAEGTEDKHRDCIRSPTPSSRLTDWLRPAHQATFEHPSLQIDDSASKDSGTDDSDNNRQQEEAMNFSSFLSPSGRPQTVDATLATIRQALQTLQNTATGTTVSPYPSQADGQALDPNPSVANPIVQETVVLSPFTQQTSFTPLAPPVQLTPAAGPSGGAQAVQGTTVDVGLLAALEQEYRRRLGSLHRQEERAEVSRASQQREREALTALEKQNRELVLLLRQKDAASFTAPAEAGKGQRSPTPADGTVALTQEIAQLKFMRYEAERLLAEEKEARKHAETLVESAKKSQSVSAKVASERQVKVKELEGKLVDEKKLREIAEKRLKEVDHGRNNEDLLRQLNLKQSQLRNAIAERDAWEVKCRAARNEYSKIADKLKMIRMEDAALHARSEEAKDKGSKEDSLAKDKKDLKEAVIKERETADRIRGERSALQHNIAKLKEQLAQYQSQPQPNANFPNINHFDKPITPPPPAKKGSRTQDSDVTVKAERKIKQMKEYVQNEDEGEVVQDIMDVGLNVYPIRKGNEGWSDVDANSGEGVFRSAVMKNDVSEVERPIRPGSITSPVSQTLTPLSALKPLTPSMATLLEPDQQRRPSLSIMDELFRSFPNSGPNNTSTGLKFAQSQKMKDFDLFNSPASSSRLVVPSNRAKLVTLDPFADLSQVLESGLGSKSEPHSIVNNQGQSLKAKSNSPELL